MTFERWYQHETGEALWARIAETMDAPSPDS